MDRERHGAAARYREFLHRHERLLRWLCLRRALGDPDLADDYFQEVSLSLWRYLPNIDSDMTGRQERFLVKRIARFALGHCTRGRHPDLRQLQAEMMIALDRRDKEDESLLNTFAEALPKKERVVVGLYRSGYEVAEIATFLDMKPNAVSQRLHRAVRMMQTMYEKENNRIKQMSHGEKRDN